MTEIKEQFKEAAEFYKKHNKKILLAIALLIPLILTIFLRIQPAYLPITNQWAENSVMNGLKANLEKGIRIPATLPKAQKDAYLNAQVKKFEKENKDLIKKQIDATSQSFKSRFKDDNGQTYLLAIDPYYYATYARNQEELGMKGTTIKDGKEWDEKAIAPLGRAPPTEWHVNVINIVHKILGVFGSNNILRSSFYVPVIISALAILPLFFLLKKTTGLLGAATGSTLLGVHTAFLTRTVAGFSDTDAYNVFFPLLIGFILFFSFKSKDKHKTIMYAVLAGLTTATYSRFWSGWWYIFDISLATLGLYFLYQAYLYYKKKESLKHILITGGSYFTSTLLFLGVVSTKGFFNGIMNGINAIIQFPLSIVTIKDVATKNIWPNVFTTVAELNASSVTNTINTMGGKVLLTLVFIGIGMLFYQRKKETIFIGFLSLVWTAVAIYASTKGIRFTLILVPAYAIGIGAFIGLSKKIIEENADKWKIPKISGTILMVIIAILLLTNPVKAGYNQSINEVPSMNDAWWNSLTMIKDNSADNAIITSWWDFGHWFRFVADRAATFDGASQNRPQAHWVGRMLQTDNEKEAIGLLRMMDCGASNALLRIQKNTTEREAVNHIKNLVLMNREEAEKYIEDEQLPNVIEQTHCEAPEAFVIASEDMVGKAGVWGHFGSWDFEKADMVVNVRSKTQNEGVKILTEEFGKNESEAKKLYKEIVENDPNQWITTWPGYLSRFTKCEENCVVGLSGQSIKLEYNNSLEEMKIFGTNITVGMTLVKGNETIHKSGETQFEVVRYNNKVMLTHPLLSNSIFTKMFFLDGKGLNCFNKFDERRQITGQKIAVYEVNWSCE